jgi:hypothetical protein
MTCGLGWPNVLQLHVHAQYPVKKNENAPKSRRISVRCDNGMGGTHAPLCNTGSPPRVVVQWISKHARRRLPILLA